MLLKRSSLELKRMFSKIIKSPLSDIQLPSTTIDEYTMEHWSKWEDKTAIECGVSGRKMSYRQLRERSKSLGCSLARMGMSSSTILFVLPNCPEYPLALLAALQAGITVSTASPIYTKEELKHQSKDSGASCIVTDPECLDRVLQVAKAQDLPVICTGPSNYQNVISFEQLCNSGKAVDCQLPNAEEKKRQLALLLYSSGTTGLPKGVRLSHANITSNMAQVSHPKINYFIETTDCHQDVVPAVLPFFHIFGLTVVMLRSLRVGAKLVSLPKFDPIAFFRIIANNNDIVLNAVPPIINLLGNHPMATPENLRGLRFTLNGAAPCSPQDMARVSEKKPHTILQGYGMTESSPVLTFPTVDSTNTGTVGVLIPNTEARVIDVNSGDSLESGVSDSFISGELCFKGPQIMKGYHNNPQATADTIDSDGWLHTGDIGYADKQGKFFVVDRIKELIKVKGFQVAPAELEAVLREHPMIAEAGVTSVIHPRSGELPVAFLVPAPGYSIDLEEVSSWMNDKLASYKRPAKLLLVDEIPKSSSGKILRRQLKEIAKAEAMFG